MQFGPAWRVVGQLDTVLNRQDVTEISRRLIEDARTDLITWLEEVDGPCPTPIGSDHEPLYFYFNRGNNMYPLPMTSEQADECIQENGGRKVKAVQNGLANAWTPIWEPGPE